MFLIKIPDIPEYNLAFNIDSAKALFWYLLWSFNIPEEFKKQIVNNLLIFNPKFFSEYYPLILKTFIGFFLTILIGFIVPIIKILKRKMKVNHKFITFSFIWFIIAILPVLFLPNHTFSMYLTLPCIGIYFLITYFVLNYGVKKLVIPLILIWLATSFTTLSFYRVNSWMIEAQRFTKEFSIQVKKQFPRLPQNSILLYQLNDNRHIQALDGENALRAIYGDSTLSIYYNRETLFADINKDKIGPVYIYIPE
jgi:hypothetical protein